MGACQLHRAGAVLNPDKPTLRTEVRGGRSEDCMDSAPSHVFITGGTGYIGSRLIPRLLAGGHKVSALVRPESQGKLPVGCEAVSGNALDAASYRDRIRPATTLVQLVGVPHPSPAKAAQFRSIDLVAGREAVRV